jgi:acyl carrier protein
VIAESVVGAIAKVKRIPEDRITLESTFAELEIDSLDGVEIVCELEERFDIAIPDDVARNMTSVGQVVDSLRPLVGGGGAASGPAGGDG